MQFCEAELRVNKSKLVLSPEDLQIIGSGRQPAAEGGRTGGSRLTVGTTRCPP